MGKLLGRTRRGAEEGMDRRSAANSLHYRPLWCLAVSGNLGAGRFSVHLGIYIGLHASSGAW